MFRVARAVLLSMHASEDFGGAEKSSAVEQIKPDCCHTPAVVSILTDSAARVTVLFYVPPHHYIIIKSIMILLLDLAGIYIYLYIS